MSCSPGASSRQRNDMLNHNDGVSTVMWVVYESRKRFALRNCSQEKRVYPSIGCF